MSEYRLNRRNRADIPSIARQASTGAAAGVALAALFISVGVIRALLFLMSGGRLQSLSMNDLRLAAFYVGGFGVAGAILGPILPRVRGPVGTYAAFGAAGVIVVTAILASESGGLAGHRRGEIIVILLLGAGFGCAFAYGLRK